MWRYFKGLFTLRGLIKRAYWDSLKLHKYQEKKLRMMVNYAYNKVPYYNKLFKKIE